MRYKTGTVQAFNEYGTAIVKHTVIKDDASGNVNIVATFDNYFDAVRHTSELESVSKLSLPNPRRPIKNKLLEWINHE